jgi:two-component system CheB/CheR fusion protein
VSRTLGHQPSAQEQPARSPESSARSAAGASFSYAEVHQRALAQARRPRVVDREGNIVHMSEQAGQFLRMAGGEPSRNLLA